jgi:hypothetical protein
VPHGVPVEVRRSYAGRLQRIEGAWSWFGTWTENGSLRDCGSQFTMSECVRATALDMSISHEQVSLDPLASPVIALLRCGHRQATDPRTRRGQRLWCSQCRRESSMQEILPGYAVRVKRRRR